MNSPDLPSAETPASPPPPSASLQPKLPGPRRGEILAGVEITACAYGGAGVGRVGGMVVFVEGALPGDTVDCRITKKKSNFAEAETVRLIAPSAARTQPPCPVFGRCGGCRWQDLEYTEQLRWKQQHIAEALRHIGGRHELLPMRPILPSPEPWHYRNKMEFSFGWEGHAAGSSVPRERATDFSLGMHLRGDFRRIVPITKCYIMADELNPVLAWFEEELRAEARAAATGAAEDGPLAKSLGLAKGEPWFIPYDQRRHTGSLRHLIFRFSKSTGQFLAALLTAKSPWKPERAAALGERLLQRFPACAGFLWGENHQLSDVARCDLERLRLGSSVITERLGQFDFRVSNFSFFQTNSLGAERLYDVVRDFAELTGRETVLDAYCGTGTIGTYLSGQAARVVGIELVPEAVQDARHNAAANGAENCTFLAGDMREVLPTVAHVLGKSPERAIAEGGLFDVIVVDPPRGGMEKRALKLLLELRAPRLIYVSCNPATLARDTIQLAEAGYMLEAIQPVDMFPHTYHVESVLRFGLSPQQEPPATPREATA